MLFLMMAVGFAVSPDSHVAFLADDLRSFVPARVFFVQLRRTCAEAVSNQRALRQQQTCLRHRDCHDGPVYRSQQSFTLC
jgi:hypothetical protein